MRQRSEVIRQIADATYDVCVIGGGASGAGCALDAQLRGLRTVLVDGGDFGGATSSASTKLVHGGLRYLQQAVTELDLEQYKVVRVALRERALMMSNAPHLTRSCRFAVPCFGIAQAGYYEIGLKVYDWLSGKASLAGSHFLGRTKSIAAMPWLKPDRLFGTVLYSDGQFDDARYNLALVQSCAAAGGDVLNYAAVRGFVTNDHGQIVAAMAEDRETNAAFRITARAFVNATGPFSDSIRQMAVPSVRPRIRVSKGVHILLPLPANFQEFGLLIPATEDGRVIFAIPWMGRLLVGTTETEATADAEMTVTREEAEYLLRHLNRYMARSFGLSDVVDAMAGLRPLIQPHDARDSRKIARDYEIEVEPQSGLISMLGGKWTVYRAMAEDAVNAVEKRLNNRTTECRTRDHKLFGSAERSGDHLVSKFGSRAEAVLELARRDPQLLTPLAAGAPHIRAEVVWCAREEMVLTLEDVLKRRIGLQYYDWRMAMEAAPIAGELLAGELQWTAMRTHTEVRTYLEKVQRLQQEMGILNVKQALSPVRG